MAICASCGNEGAKGVTFCKHCGQEMTSEEITTYAVKDPSTGPLYYVPIGQYIRKGWAIFLQYPAGFVGFILILAIVIVLLLLINYYTPIPFFWYFLTAILEPLCAGIYVVSAKLLQRQACAFIDFFAGFHYFLPLLIFGLIFSLIALGDTLFRYYLIWHYPLLLTLWNLASLPITLAILFTPMLVIDRGLPLWEAMGLSRRTVYRRWLPFLGLIILLGLISLVIGPVIALMVTQVSVLFKLAWVDFRTVLFICLMLMKPIYFLVFTVAYANLFGIESQEY